jgi:hypothetical protein
MPCILNLTVHPDMTQHHMVLVDWYLLNNSDQQYNYSLLVLLFVGLQDSRIQQHRVLCNLYYLFLHSKILVDNHYNHSVRCFQQSLTWCQLDMEMVLPSLMHSNVLLDRLCRMDLVEYRFRYSSSQHYNLPQVQLDRTNYNISRRHMEWDS